MKLLEAVMQPLPLDDLRVHFDEGRCLVLEGNDNKFTNLVSAADIERRLNDACNISHLPQVIRDGMRSSNADSNCVWAGAALKKAEFTRDIEAGLSFMMANSSQMTPELARLTTEIENYFAEEQVHADVHLYVSTDAAGNSYNAHRDMPQHKLLLQAYGEANWQIFNPKQELPDDLRAVTPEQQDQYLELASEFTLKQGDLLYMPPGVFHRVASVGGPRISISIPFFTMPDASHMDRSVIPFTQIFNR